MTFPGVAKIVSNAGIALILDAVTAALTYAMSKSSVNMRAAFLYNMADALGNVAERDLVDDFCLYDLQGRGVRRNSS